MPVRRIPKNYRSLTGLVPNSRTQSMTAFESSLERDFLQLLDFDPDVEFYEEQPVKITYPDAKGRRLSFTRINATLQTLMRLKPASLKSQCQMHLNSSRHKRRISYPQSDRERLAQPLLHTNRVGIGNDY